MKIGILTSPTLHHLWFIQELSKHDHDIICISESTGVKPPFQTFHKFERKREIYERQLFFKNKVIKFENICPTFHVENINDRDTIKILEDFRSDIIITFGTRKITDPLLSVFEGMNINLHGGDPEKYRGLDSHLWAIYHGDWSSLVTTLHIVNRDLDCGDIIEKRPLDLSKTRDLYSLRAANTVNCVQISLLALDNYKRSGYFNLATQIHKGRYYSFMPTVLKEICVKKFKKYRHSNES